MMLGGFLPSGRSLGSPGIVRDWIPLPQWDDIEIQSRFAFRQTMLSLAASLNDHPDIRRVFAGFHIEIVPIQYTVGGGRAAERNELIIFSWDDAAQPVGLC